jgi:hypothetical protein
VYTFFFGGPCSRWGGAGYRRQEWPIRTAGFGGRAIIIQEKRSCNNKSVECPDKLGSFLAWKLEQAVSPKVGTQLPDKAVDRNMNEVFIETFYIVTDV